MNVARALFLAAFLAASPALAADPADTQALYDRGLAAMKAGRFEEACPALEQSYKLDPLPGALFTLADCEAQRGRLAIAAARYDEYLAVYASLPADKKSKQGEREKKAREHRAALGPRIAELTLVLPPGAPVGTQVTRDGLTVADSALGVPTLVDPGEHVIVARTPSGSVSETRVILAAGDKRGVAITVPGVRRPAEVVKEGSPPLQPEQMGPNKAVIVAGASVAGASLVVGGVFLGLMASKSSSAGTLYTEAKQAGGCPPPSSPQTGKCAELLDALHAKSSFGSVGVWSTVGAGAVGVATVIYGVAGGGGGGNSSRGRSGLVVAPAVTAQGGGLFVSGSF